MLYISIYLEIGFYRGLDMCIYIYIYIYSIYIYIYRRYLDRGVRASGPPSLLGQRVTGLDNFIVLSNDKVIVA